MNFKNLPEDYLLIKTVNFMENKPLALWINIVALIIGVIMVAVGIYFHPFWGSSSPDDGNTIIGFTSTILRIVLIIPLLVIYVFCHEGVHGIFIRMLSGQPAYYGFTGLFAYAGSRSYLDKRSYIIVALAPIVILGAILAILNLMVSSEWYWMVYVVQIQNIAGATGDLYIVWLMSTMPKDALTIDHGTTMQIYSSKNQDV